LRLVRSDIRALPFAPASFQTVIAPYGVLQSMSGAADLAAALRSTAQVVKPRGSFWIDVAMDVPRWGEYRGRVRWRGGRGSGPTLVESVRQDRRRRLTIFRQIYTQRRGRGALRRDFELCFYTPSVAQLRAQLARAGFAVERLYGDYDDGPWQARSDALIIRARRTRS
jgi:hypothetical protein